VAAGRTPNCHNKQTSTTISAKLLAEQREELGDATARPELRFREVVIAGDAQPVAPDQGRPRRCQMPFAAKADAGRVLAIDDARLVEIPVRAGTRASRGGR